MYLAMSSSLDLGIKLPGYISCSRSICCTYL